VARARKILIPTGPQRASPGKVAIIWPDAKLSLRVWQRGRPTQGVIGNGSTCSCTLRHLPGESDCAQDGSVASSRRSSGRATPARGTGRQAPQKRGLAQGRRPVRPATPEDDEDEEEEDEEEEGEEEEETGSDEDASTPADGSRGAKSRTSTLAKEVHSHYHLGD
jgi:hypothetical protein